MAGFVANIPAHGWNLRSGEVSIEKGFESAKLRMSLRLLGFTLKHMEELSVIRPLFILYNRSLGPPLFYW